MRAAGVTPRRAKGNAIPLFKQSPIKLVMPHPGPVVQRWRGWGACLEAQEKNNNNQDIGDFKKKYVKSTNFYYSFINLK